MRVRTTWYIRSWYGGGMVGKGGMEMELSGFWNEMEAKEEEIPIPPAAAASPGKGKRGSILVSKTFIFPPSLFPSRDLQALYAFDEGGGQCSHPPAIFRRGEGEERTGKLASFSF